MHDVFDSSQTPLKTSRNVIDVAVGFRIPDIPCYWTTELPVNMNQIMQFGFIRLVSWLS